MNDISVLLGLIKFDEKKVSHVGLFILLESTFDCICVVSNETFFLPELHIDSVL